MGLTGGEEGCGQSAMVRTTSGGSQMHKKGLILAEDQSVRDDGQ